MKIGLNGKAYHGVAGAEPSDEIPAIRDVTLTIEVNAVELNSRLSNWAENEAGIRKAKVDFDMVWDGTLADQTAMQTAALAGTKRAFKFLDATLGYGYWGDFVISGFGMNQPLEDGTTIPVSLVLSGALNVKAPV